MGDVLSCAVCGRRISKDERALTKKMVNRGAESYLCLDCLAQKFETTVETLREKIVEFKEMGCTLFDENKPLNVYCFFCETGYEDSFDTTFKWLGLTKIEASVNRVVRRNGKEVTVKRAMLPGYVLFEADDLSFDRLSALRQRLHFLRFVSYPDGAYALRGRDLEFINWLKRQNGMLDVSRVCRVGTRIRVIDGPLKTYEGSIVEVNRKRSCVAIRVGEGSILNKIWCSVEYVEPIDGENDIKTAPKP